MNAVPKIISQSGSTVTLDRAEWEAYVEDREDYAAATRYQAGLHAIGAEEMQRLSYTMQDMERLIAGDSPIVIWRDRTGLSQRQLAEAAQISPSYLAEIEGRKKPGSIAAISAIAKALNVPIEHLLD